MLCDECGKRAASINLTQIVNSQMTTRRLCEVCAEAQGLKGPSLGSTPLSQFISQVGPGVDKGGGGEARRCEACGLTWEDFRTTARLGCAQCYSAFEPHLTALLRRIQGSHTHVGKGREPLAREGSTRETHLRELRKRLEESVRLEEFEMAARLRDEIRGLERGNPAEQGAT